MADVTVPLMSNSCLGLNSVIEYNFLKKETFYELVVFNSLAQRVCMLLFAKASLQREESVLRLAACVHLL